MTFCFAVSGFLSSAQGHSTVGSKIFRAFAIKIRLFSGLIANFYYLMLAISSIKPKDYDIINIICIKLH